MSSAAKENAYLDDSPLLAALLAGERFWPTEPQSVYEAGLTEPLLESLALKLLLVNGSCSGCSLAASLGLPFAIVESVLNRLRSQRLVTHRGAGTLNDYIYALTEEGHQRAQVYRRECAYVGLAPVPLVDYITSVEAQAVFDDPIRRSELTDVLHDVSVPPALLDLMGPAINAGAGLFLYGAPGNGKSTLAHRITSCFGQEIWLPEAFLVDQAIVKVFDPTYHHEVSTELGGSMSSTSYDRRWHRVRRPTVVVGGELTMESLEIQHDSVTNVSEAPLQLKSNCGCLLIDDFGRQRVSPSALLNRWIVPLESRHDFLTLWTGKKIQVPFEQLIIFSTNLDPADLVDEAFLRRIPYRIEISDPSEAEFFDLFELAAEKVGCPYDPDAVEYLLEKHYRPVGRSLRRCHPRDLLMQIRYHCLYHDQLFQMLPEYFDHVAQSFFTKVPTRGAVSSSQLAESLRS